MFWLLGINSKLYNKTIFLQANFNTCPDIWHPAFTVSAKAISSYSIRIENDTKKHVGRCIPLP